MKLHIGGITLTPNLWQAIAIVVLIFVLLLIIAYMSRQFMSWSLWGAWVLVLVGFMLALVLEGFLLIGGRTVVTSLLGWKNAPKPIVGVLSAGHQKLLDTLGVPASCSGIVK